MYKGCEDEAIDFLDRVLQFNPYFRISINEALEHPLFESIRKPEAELTAEETIKFDFEKEMLDKDRLRELFLEEIDYFKSVKE
jgi:serine/threonine protein kinase